MKQMGSNNPQTLEKEKFMTIFTLKDEAMITNEWQSKFFKITRSQRPFAIYPKGAPTRAKIMAFVNFNDKSLGWTHWTASWIHNSGRVATQYPQKRRRAKHSFRFEPFGGAFDIWLQKQIPGPVIWDFNKTQALQISMCGFFVHVFWIHLPLESKIRMLFHLCFYGLLGNPVLVRWMIVNFFRWLEGVYGLSKGKKFSQIHQRSSEAI